MKHVINRFVYTILDIPILLISFMVCAWIKPATIRLVLPQYALPFTIFAFIWFFFSSIGEKYRVVEEKNFMRIFIKVIIIDLIILAVVMLLIFGLKLGYSRLIVLGTIALSSLGELVLYFIMYFTDRFFRDNPSFARTPMVMDYIEPKKMEKDDVQSVRASYDKLCRFDPKFGVIENIEKSILMPLLTKYLDKNENVFEFINQNIALENIHRQNSTILNTSTQYNITNLDEDSQELIINLHPINDYRRINKFLMAINKALKNNGIYIGCGETLKQRRSRYLSQKYPKFIQNLFFILDFGINRAFPKISFMKGIYFAITKGRNRPLSKCEILGRMHFCGFTVIETKEIHNKLFYIMKKSSSPSEDTNPSYAPIFKMKRRGKHGKYIFVYKFRTMHPYAEYLQHYMVEKYGYGDKGKVEDDFRITAWGKWMRRLWLDESPQILNFLKGDLAIVGVRPLSERFLKEYPEDLKEKRFRYKPGCIPPYVALRKQAVDEYLESERIYLAEKERHPIWTDVKYFWWAVFNILANRIRSE